ncbi:MAG: 16S rRNA (adenine(1518)-N(6)/adenine(1519)-N(6))-dimethyltransferase RsmA [Elainellaceae cyanobacterium]
MNHRPRKRFGQHWLTSETVLHQILAAAEISKGDRILEIGPGTGLLTRWLISLAESVVAVEIDRDLCSALRTKFQNSPNFFLIEGDILNLNLDNLGESLPDTPDWRTPNKVVANIPYYITGPILEKLLGTIAAPNPDAFDMIVLLVQKEVAMRLCAQSGSSNFGALSVRIQYLADCELVCGVPPKAFTPPPAVESAVVKLRPRLIEPTVEAPQRLEALVKMGFNAKRKMLRNNLKNLIERDRLIEVLERLDLNPQARAEDLGVTDWIALSNHLSQGELSNR